MRNRLIVLFSFWAAALDPAVRAETPPEMAVPTLGYVFDAAMQRLRPLAGTPGAAMVTSPVSGITLREAITPPSPGWVLAVDAEQGVPGILRRPANTFHPLPGISRTARIRLSPLGKSALIVLPDARVQRVCGLPDAPLVSEASALPEGVMAQLLAISDDGSTILAPLEDGGLLRITASDGAARLAPTDGPVRALAFRPGSTDGVFADSFAVALSRGMERQPVMSLREEDGLPTAVATTSNGERVITAFAKGRIRITSLPGGITTDLNCACEATGLHLLPDHGALFRLDEFRGQPLRLLDAAGPEPRVWFVPVQPEGEQ